MALATRRGFQAGLRCGGRRPIPAPVVGRWCRHDDRGPRHAILRLDRAADASALWYAQARALRPLDRPAPVIRGERDPYLPLRLAGRQRDAFPSAHLVVLPDSGHVAFADDPQGVREATLPFVRRQLAG
jgi:pimeloyl-ACP methyl ester carboxylesterase